MRISETPEWQALAGHHGEIAGVRPAQGDAGRQAPARFVTRVAGRRAQAMTAVVSAT